jgi:predicted DNA binding CopG/RHH family protein
MKGDFMKKAKKSVKTSSSNKKMYESNKIDEKEVLEARERRRLLKKPTSVALDQETITKLKEVANERGIPYQVLMRSYILKGLKDDLAS